MNRDNDTILQWNCQGARAKKDEIIKMIEDLNPIVVALQETMIGPSNNFRAPNYVCIRKDGHFNRRPHGGVALLVHNTIPFTELKLQTDLQACAIRVKLRSLITICNIYNSRSHDLTEPLLQQLFDQLPPPVLMVGDFNSYHVMWGSSSTDTRGKIIESFIGAAGLNLLNTGSPTRITHTETAIDLSLCSPELQRSMVWSVDPSPGDSDHCPITIRTLANINSDDSEIRNYKAADWQSYENFSAWDNIPPLEDVAQSVEDLYNRFNSAASATIPKVKMKKFFPKSWWSVALNTSLLKRETMYNTYRHNKSPQNLKRWKKARAEHRNSVQKHKKDSWKKMLTCINKDTPISKVWESVHKIEGNRERKINILTVNNIHYSSIPEIANKLADTFCQVSKLENYNDQFQQHRTLAEDIHLNFESDNSEPYNQPITLDELKHALQCTKDTSPGPDNVTYSMIKHVPMEAAEHILKIFNKIFTENYFPPQWSESTIVPIPKPNKDHSNPLNYRPIALTSNLCKTMERILNDRLLDHLDSIVGFGLIQAGGRKGRSTLDHLLRLETAIRNALVNGEHLISIFFDIEKAYDTTWRYGIMKDLYDLGLRGRLPKFINKFLQNRTFKVRLNSTLSRPLQQESGIPQGSVLSVTLFIIKIDSISKLIPREERFLSSLYIDDLQLSYAHSDLRVIGQKLQETLDKISSWSLRNGFKFSIAKTFMIHFHSLPGVHLPPVLNYNNQVIPYVDTARFLGVTFDSRLTWKPHIAKLKASCQKALNLLKTLTTTKWGADQESLMYLYRALVRSRLDYGAIVYNSAHPTTLKQLDPIANEAMRIASGAFKSSPISSLQVLLNETSLAQRRKLQSLKFYFKMKSQLYNSAYNATIIPRFHLLFVNKNVTPPFPIRVYNMMQELDINRGYVQPSFSYKLLKITKPTWQLEAPLVNLELSAYPKKDTSDHFFSVTHRDMIETNFRNMAKIYTDGSKTDGGVGAAAVWDDVITASTLPREATVYTAEMKAINLGLDIINANQIQRTVILSDSLSVLQKLEGLEFRDGAVRRLQHRLDQMKDQGHEVQFGWVPGHVGVPGNEKADREAKKAAGKTPEFVCLPYTDYVAECTKKMKQAQQQEWELTGDKLLPVKPDIGPWKRVKTDRRQHVIINRLRIGHTNLTHSYLMDNVLRGPDVCPVCDNHLLTVKHILTECSELEREREHFFNSKNPNMKTLLGDGNIKGSLIQFLKYIGAYDLI